MSIVIYMRIIHNSRRNLWSKYDILMIFRVF